MSPRKKHPGTLEQRGSSFRVILYSGGQRHTYTLADVERPEAARFARRQAEKLRAQLKRQRLGLPGPMPVSALLDKFESDRFPVLAPRTRETYAASLAIFREFFAKKGDPLVEEVRAGHVQDFLNWRRTHRLQGRAGGAVKVKGGVASNRTLQKDRTVLHAVFSFAEDLELRDGNPVARVRPPKADTRDPVLLSVDQYERLLRECDRDPMLWLYALMLGETGARSKSEALRLRWPDLDLEGGFVWIPSDRTGHRTKSGKGRWVPCTPRLAEALRQHAATCRLARYDGKRSEYLFHHTRRRRGAQPGERMGTFRNALARAAERAELPRGWRPHDLRHRRVTTWLAAGHSVVLVKEAMGHSDTRTTAGYTHLAREHLRGLVEQPDRQQLSELRNAPAASI